ncbi:hypothetical protein KY312_03010 [Candidatus Woesearchaeota archaeon]|nr:hypothetical protein [Candidatus Woesearchaeota archaeon]
MTVSRTLFAGFIAAVIAFVYGFFTNGFLFSWIYLIVPGAELWKEMTGLWYLWAVIIILSTHIIFAFIYALIQEGIPGIRYSKGFFFGLMIWLIGIVAPNLSILLTMKISIFIPLYAIINGLIQYTIIGIVYSAILTLKK